MVQSTCSGSRARQRSESAIAAGRAVEELSEYLRPSIEERRRTPKDDLLSVLLQAEVEGTRLKVEELIGNCVLLLVAGHETTTNLIGSAFYSLLRNPTQLAMYRGGVANTAAVTAEVLRYESPAQIIPRLARKETLLAGQKINSGDMCWMLIGSANRDESEFERADCFEITRASNKNLAFGEGIHRCVGASLAEVELEIALTAELPISVQVYEGNTLDHKTVSDQIKKLKERFGVKRVVMVGDRGMLKQAQIEELGGFEWNYITALTKPELESLVEQNVIQLSLFDEQICEVEQADRTLK